VKPILTVIDVCLDLQDRDPVSVDQDFVAGPIEPPPGSRHLWPRSAARMHLYATQQVNTLAVGSYLDARM
jgi:hypothetical protein